MTDDLLKNGYIAISDLSEDHGATSHDMLKSAGIGAVLAVPVMVHDALSGVLVLFSPAPRTFNAGEIAFLTALADQGGIAFDRARLIEHIRRNSRLVHDLSVSINASLDFKQILSALTVDLGHAYNAKGVSVLLLDEDQRVLTPVASMASTVRWLTQKCGQTIKPSGRHWQGKPFGLMMPHATTVCLTRRYIEKRRLQPF